MSATHTPGPWRTAEEYKGTTSIYGRSIDPFDDRPMTDRDTYICAVQKGRWIYEQAANARLISASPDLLKALESAVKYLDANRPKGKIKDIFGALVDHECVMKQARLAIAKGTP